MEVVRDQKLITSRKPANIPAINGAVLRALKARANAGLIVATNRDTSPASST
jgi:hypothetical protein